MGKISLLIYKFIKLNFKIACSFIGFALFSSKFITRKSINKGPIIVM